MVDLPAILEEAALRYRGPGGAIAVVQDGKLAAQRVWGFADIALRIPMEPSTILPICSISKQMVCAVIHDLKRSPTAKMASADVSPSELLERHLHEMLGHQDQLKDLSIQYLSNNQSGIRDYWATNTLLGAHPEDLFSLETHAVDMVRRIKSLHFTPGSEYSYSNTNFHILGRVAERASGQSLPELLSERIFRPAKMTTASLHPPSDDQPGPCVGYEVNEALGYFPAKNRIEWSGDAGIVASLEDMIAYEIYLHQLWADPKSWYREHAVPGTFSDGTPSLYANGLSFADLDGIPNLGHGGALRGYRLYRRHTPSREPSKGGISVVVMLNHEADAAEASSFITRKILGLAEPTVAPFSHRPATEWEGHFLDKGTNMAVSGDVTKPGIVAIDYARKAETVRLIGSNEAESGDMKAEIRGDTIHVRRLRDNRILEGTRLHPDAAKRRDPSLPGEYFCQELDSSFLCIGQGEVLYGAFKGPLGSGGATAMRYLGGDVWLLACPRGQDAQPPGDWTIVFHRDASQGKITGMTIGCWLARNFEFEKQT
ncbi:unnamed protein product [Clonostachys rhizophaga]|uniref:D-aminopeptidase n=1 Tax=Clonostachys rhizophaga TaxID=160324 RepID=A0A9N9V2H5_9HYPO|nr:unnamed protein product [Clonostachys rhizophaga]